LHKDKSIFKLEDLPVDRFAESLGLPGTPKIKFLSKAIVKQKKNASRAVEAAQADIDQDAQISSVASGSEDEDDGNDGSSSSEDNETRPRSDDNKLVKVRFLIDF